MVSVGVVIFTVSLMVPWMFELEVVEVSTTNNVTGEKETELMLVRTAYGNSYFYTVVVKQLLENIIVFASFAVFIGANLSIIVVLVRQRHKTSAMTSQRGAGSSSAMQKVTTMVLTISVFLFVGRALDMSVNILRATSQYESTDPRIHGDRPLMVMTMVSVFYFILNASINFFFYCIIGDLFRKRFMRMYGCGLVGRLRSSFRASSRSRVTRTTRTGTSSGTGEGGAGSSHASNKVEDEKSSRQSIKC